MSIPAENPTWAFATGTNLDQSAHTSSLIWSCTGHVKVTEALKKLLINFGHRSHTAWMHRQVFIYTCAK